MKTIFKSFLLVLALIASTNTAYATNSFTTKNADGTYTGTIYGTISAELDSWMELDKGTGFQQYNRSTKPAGEISATVPGLACDRSYPYRTAAAYNGSNLYGQVFNLRVNCEGVVTPPVTSITVSTDSASPSQTTATLYATVSASADSWIEINTGLNGANNIQQIGRGTRSGSYNGYVSGLQCNSRYNYRAVAQGSNGLVYGTTRSFDTNACNGTVINNNNITVSTDSASPSQTTATLYATVSASADSWIEINTGLNGANNIQQIGRGTRSGSYNGYVSGLQCNSRYNYRAVAQGSNGLVYGTTRSFDTNACNGGTVNNTNISALTTVATGVGYNVARLNGIGLVNTTPTNAYFEWGTSASNLNNRTQTKTYLESNSVPVLDVLTGLSPNTTYYYRVIAQNPGGNNAYGNIVSFRTATTPTTTVVNTGTNTNTVNTVRTVTTGTTNTVRSTAGTTNTNGVVYIPVQLASVGSVGTVTTGVNGSTNVPSFATVGVVKSSADGCENTFTITYTNTSDKLLSNTILSVNLPNELEFVSATDGSFRATDSTLTIPVGSLEARQSKTVTITTKVLGGAQNGKQVAVTAYLNYTEGSSNAQNQVTGYSILTLADDCTTTVAKTSQAGAAGLFGFLPNNIWQWILVLFAIALIIIAGRSLFGGSKPAAH